MDVKSLEYRNFMEKKLMNDFWFMRISYKQKLKDFPYYIEEEDSTTEYSCFPIEWGNGWFEKFYNLCDSIKDEVGPTFHWEQLKEKFGTARCYFEGEISEVGAKKIREFEDLTTATTCELCGKPGAIDYKKYWLTCLCEDCKSHIKG